MWIPRQVVEWFTSMRDVAETNAMVSIEAINQYREQLAAVTADRDALKLHTATVQNTAEWLRIRVNALEVERAQLIEKAYGIKLPAPELVRPAPPASAFDSRNLSFDDLGDTVAKELGLPLYDTKQ